jgi:arylsulfotransferase ASST
VRERILFATAALVAAAAAVAPGARAGTTLSFHSAPGLHPPRLTLTSDPDRRSGDIFLTPFNSPQVGPMVVNSQGRLVWFRPVHDGEALNLQVQRYQGRPVLTWWQGPLALGHGTIYGVGEDVIADSSYRTVAVVHAGHGYSADLHEFQITPQGTALLDAYVPVRRNLTRFGGAANGTVLDCVVQELNIRTGKVLWEWHSLEHVPLSASYQPVGRSPSFWFDYFHLNSIQQLTDGNMLISSRNTWAIYEISRKTGQVLWTLGGKRSSFSMGPGTNFEWQHDARLHQSGLLSLFDDASAPPEETQASAKVLRLDTTTMTARLVASYPHSPPLLPGLAGNAQLLANHDIFVGWGGSPDFSEYAPGGRQLFNGTFPAGIGSYRAFRFPWVGNPLTRPSAAVVRTTNGAAVVYASWNGATQVTGWRLLGGSAPGALRGLGPIHARTGFETALPLHARPKYLAVQALTSDHRLLGTSPVQPR